MANKRTALVILGALFLCGSATPDAQERLGWSTSPQEISPRILDTFLKPPPQQAISQQQANPPQFPGPIPFMQRIARWFLNSDPPANQRLFYQPPKQPQIAAQKYPTQHPVKEDCRPCNSIPWIPMFPIKEAITDAVFSLVAGQNTPGEGIRPKEPQIQPIYPPPGPPKPTVSPPKYHPQPQHVSSLPPRPIPTRPPPAPIPTRPPAPSPTRPPVTIPARPPPLPARPPAPIPARPPAPLPARPPAPGPTRPPYKVPLGDQRPVFTYLSPPLNRPSIYGQMRPYLPFGYFPQKEEITVTIHENKNRPNAIYNIPGGPQIHLMSEPRPTGVGAEHPKVHAEVIPSIPIADYLSSIEYPMEFGKSHLMDFTKDTPRKPEGDIHDGGHPPIHYGQDAGIIGPLPQSSAVTNRPPFGYENGHQEGPTGGLNNPHYSFESHPSEHQHSSPEPAHESSGYSSPSPPYSSIAPKNYSSTHIINDIPTISSTIGTITPERSSTLAPAFDSTTRASVISTVYSSPTGSSTEAPKFSNSFSPPASTHVDIQPSLQTAEYLSSLSHNSFRVHQGQGFRLSESYPFNGNLGFIPFQPPNKQTLGDVKGHYITKHPPSSTPHPHINRPPPAPFKVSKEEQNRHPVSLAPNPALWTKEHPYSFEIPPTDISHNQDPISTGSGQSQVPSNNPHFLEEPPIYSFIHNGNEGHHQHQHDTWRFESETGVNGPSTAGPISSSPHYGNPPTPFTTSTTSRPPVNIPHYSSSTAPPKFSEDLQDQTKSKNKKTKQVQIIIPYITGGSLKEVGQNGFSNWHQREDDYHDHQESRTVTASALHPNLGANNDSKQEISEEKYQHILAPHLKNLLQTEVEDNASENPLLRLQKNIDAWTAEQFSNTPSSVTKEGATTKSVRFIEDHEVSGSHDHAETVRFETTTTPRNSLGESSTLGIHSNLVIPNGGESVQVAKQEESTTANWSKTKVAISPTTKEKVYVVTPMTLDDETTTESQTIQRGVSSARGTSPRFLIRPTPGEKPSHGISLTTNVSVRENAADLPSNEIFQPSERARHKASEGSFFGGLETIAAAVPTPSYTLLPGTQVKTYAGHSRVVTSVSAPTYSYSKTTLSPAEDAESSTGSAPKEQETKESSN